MYSECPPLSFKFSWKVLKICAQTLKTKLKSYFDINQYAIITSPIGQVNVCYEEENLKNKTKYFINKHLKKALWMQTKCNMVK